MQRKIVSFSTKGPSVLLAPYVSDPVRSIFSEHSLLYVSFADASNEEVYAIV